METFIFNLNKNAKYKKKIKNYSLYSYNNYGMYTVYFGNHNDCETMKKIKHYSNHHRLF